MPIPFRQSVRLFGSLALLLARAAAFAPTPVIGIVSQPLSTADEYGNSSLYIAASYVKWLEAGGARSIPIPYDASTDVIDELFGQVSGVLFPGGAAELPESVKYLWKLIVTANAEDDWFPVWGTCLGFEWLLQLGSENNTILDSDYDANNISLPLLNVQPHQLYRKPQVFDNVRKNNITMNNHHQGILPHVFAQTPKLSDKWKITSINYDVRNKPFVSTMEPIHPDIFPVYGVQYHPEKNAFEYATYPHTNIPYEAINHSPQAIDLTMELARWFVELTKHTNPARHCYSKPDVYPLVYSYPMTRSLKFEQIYMMPSKNTLTTTHVDNILPDNDQISHIQPFDDLEASTKTISVA